MFGLDIGAENIKVAEVNKTGGKLYLEKFETINKSNAMKKGLKIKKAVVTIQDEEIKFFAYSFENPKKLSSDELKKLITEKSRDFLKFPSEKANVGLQILDQYSKNGIYHYNVFAEILSIDVLNNYKNILKDLKVKPIAVDSSTYRLANLCDAKNFILSNITEKEIIIFCYYDGKPVYVRRATKYDLKLPDNITDLAGERNLFMFVKDTVDYYYEKFNSKFPEKAFVAGNLTSRDFITVLNELLNIPVEPIFKSKLIKLKCLATDENLLQIAPCIGAVLGEYE